MAAKVFTVYRVLTSKTGAVIQIPYKSYTTEAVAKQVAEECQEDMRALMSSQLFLPMGNKLSPLEVTVGKMMTELGIVNYGHVIGWAEVTESDIVVPEAKVIVPTSH